MKRHRDDEDFPDPDGWTDDIDQFLKSIPALPRQPDEPGEFQTDDEIEIVVEAMPPAGPAWGRAATRPISKQALAVRELQLAGERRISEQDGRTPLEERIPGQGRAVRFV